MLNLDKFIKPNSEAYYCSSHGRELPAHKGVDSQAIQLFKEACKV